MDNKTLIQNLILEILASTNIDEKRSKRKQVVGLFKESVLVDLTPIAIRLNTGLKLKESIDDFIVHDSATSRESVKNIYMFVSRLLPDVEKVA